MNYSKPEITSLASASLLIHGDTNLKQGGPGDVLSPFLQIVPAYEAGE